MSKQTQITVNLQNSLNRAIIYTAYPLGKPINFTILHHKKTSALQFDVDSRFNPIKNNESRISMFRNLENCKFTNTFFKLENLKTSNYDYQCKFGGVDRVHEKHIYPFMKEKIDFQSGNSRDTSTNYLLVLGWKIFDIEDDFIFFFVQRRCFNNISRTNVIRTAGLQFATVRGLDILDKYVDNSENLIQKVDNFPNFNEFDDPNVDNDQNVFGLKNKGEKNEIDSSE